MITVKKSKKKLKKKNAPNAIWLYCMASTLKRDCELLVDYLNDYGTDSNAWIVERIQNEIESITQSVNALHELVIDISTATMIEGWG